MTDLFFLQNLNSCTFNLSSVTTTLLKIVKGIRNVFYCPNKACLNSFIKPSLWFWSLDTRQLSKSSLLRAVCGLFFIKINNSNLYLILQCIRHFAWLFYYFVSNFFLISYLCCSCRLLSLRWMYRGIIYAKKTEFNRFQCYHMILLYSIPWNYFPIPSTFPS